MSANSILITVKGHQADDEAVLLACSLARGAKAKLYALYIIEVRRTLPLDAEIAGETAKGEEVLQRIERLCEEQKCPVEAEILQAREVGPAVVQEAMERDVELLVIGMPYKKRFGSFSLGNTVPHILKNAPCRVLIWREKMVNGNS